MDIIDKILSLEVGEFIPGEKHTIIGYRGSGLTNKAIQRLYPIGTEVEVYSIEYNQFSPPCYDRCEFVQKHGKCVKYKRLDNNRELWSCYTIVDKEGEY